MDWNRRVGDNLRRFRAERDLTQEALAAEAGLAERHVGRIERGESSATVTALGKLAKALAIDPREFFSVPSASRGD